MNRVTLLVIGKRRGDLVLTQASKTLGWEGLRIIYLQSYYEIIFLKTTKGGRGTKVRD